MSGEAMKWARDQRFGAIGLKAMVNAIAARADAKGTTWAAQATLAADMGASVRHVRRLLCELQALGVIERKARSGGRIGRLSDVVSLPLHKTFDVAASEVRKARRTASKRTTVSGWKPKFQADKFVVPSGHPCPGIIKGTTSQSYPRSAGLSEDGAGGERPRLKVVGGTAREGGQ